MLARTCLNRNAGILALFVSLLSVSAAQAYVPGAEVVGSFGSLIAPSVSIFRVSKSMPTTSCESGCSGNHGTPRGGRRAGRGGSTSIV